MKIVIIGRAGEGKTTMMLFLVRTLKKFCEVKVIAEEVIEPYNEGDENSEFQRKREEAIFESRFPRLPVELATLHTNRDGKVRVNLDLRDILRGQG